MANAEAERLWAARYGLALGLAGLRLGVATAALAARLAFLGAGRVLRGTFRRVGRQTSVTVEARAHQPRRGGCLLKRCGC